MASTIRWSRRSPASSCSSGPPSARSSSTQGCSPGRSSTCRQPALPGSAPAASAGRTPARSSEDFPIPDGPRMPTSGHSASRAISSETTRSRPQKKSASEPSKAARPLNGHSTGAGGADVGPRGREPLVVAQDHVLELAQLGARGQPELVAQQRARLPVGGERVGLAPGAIQRQHELRRADAPAAGPARSASRAGRSPRRRAPARARHRPAPSRRAGRSSSRRRISGCTSSNVARSASGGPRHSAEPLAQPRRGADVVAVLEQAAPLGQEPLEPGRIELLGLELEHVAAAARDGASRAVVA